MSHASPPPAGAPAPVRHRLLLEAEPCANLLARLLEPFVIHDVLPARIDSAADGDALRVALDFCAPADLAARLHGRLAAMVGVRKTALVPAARDAVEKAA